MSFTGLKQMYKMKKEKYSKKKSAVWVKKKVELVLEIISVPWSIHWTREGIVEMGRV